MAKPFRKPGSDNYYVEIWSHGERRTLSLGTDNYGIARTRTGQLENDARTSGLNVPTRTEVGPLVERFARHLVVCQRRKSAQTDAYRLRECFGAPAGDGPPTLAPRRGLVRRPRAQSARYRPKEYGCALKIRYIEQVTTSMLVDFLTKLVEQRGIGPKTWNEYRGVLHRFCEWAAVSAGVVMPGKINPATAVPTRKVDPPKITFLNLTQIREQLAALAGHPQIQTMVAVYIYAGLRREELLWLTPADADLEHRVIHVRAKTVAGRSWRPKTNRNRKVSISAALFSYLQAYTSPNETEWLFPSPEGCWWNPDNFSYRLADLNRKAGLEWSCAEYRHTFGTQLAMAGRDERTIAELMGNSPAIVRRHYAAWLPSAHPEAVEFDTPAGPVPMAQPEVANLRVEAERRGLRVVRAE